MKKILCLLLILLLSGCTLNVRNITKTIELNNKNCIILREKNTHGGFLGDGEYFAEIECKNLNYSDLSSNWKKFPVPFEIENVTEMIWCDFNKCGNFYERYNVSNIENGYYFFLDRHSDSKNKYDFTELNSRTSYNFTLAMYDIQNSHIYYFEMDT